MSLTLIGKKRGMTRVFCKKSGKNLPCTVLEVQPNQVVQSKSVESDGYEAVKLSAFTLSEVQKKRAKKPDLGQFKDGLTPMKTLIESRGSFEQEPGDLVDLSYFTVGGYVDVRGTSKGKGYQGVIKRHGVARIVSSHGAGPVVRHIGSSGFMTSHGRVHKGKKDSGQMGNALCYAEGLEILEIDLENGILVVKGGVPGPNGGTVYIRNNIKGKK
ncbi:MAG: 50S ribosomal protein L3 [Chlamydiia bacterium]|nr:50S ribosomal protein L3 [Chlamydiia bacterium]